MTEVPTEAIPEGGLGNQGCRDFAFANLRFIISKMGFGNYTS